MSGIESDLDSISSSGTSDSSSAFSLSDIERPENYFRTELGDEMYEKVKEWLISKCQRHFILHKDRERQRTPSQQSLDFSWKWFKEDFLRAFPSLTEWLGDNRSDWGILGMWEDEVFQPWMILPKQYQEAGKEMSANDAMALARIFCLVATADRNMTSFVCRILERESPPSPSAILRSVEREAQKKGRLDQFTAAFNMPAAKDLVQFLIGALE